VSVANNDFPSVYLTAFTQAIVPVLDEFLPK
jgi:hypothetical protein